MAYNVADCIHQYMCGSKPFKEPEDGRFELAIEKDDVVALKELLAEMRLDEGEQLHLLMRSIKRERYEMFRHMWNLFNNDPVFNKVICPVLTSIELKLSDNFIVSLIDGGFDVKARDINYKTTLHLAVELLDSTRVAKLLIERGIDIDARDFEGSTPLHYAIYSSDVEKVCMLLYCGCDANSSAFRTKTTPFMAALVEKNVEMQRHLLDYVCDFNEANARGYNILYLALHHKSPLAREIAARGGGIGSNVDLLFTGRQTFDLLWPMVSRDVVLQQRFPVLRKLLRQPSKSAGDFLYYFYALTASRYADLLMDQYLGSIGSFGTTLFSDVVECFAECGLERAGRLSVIYVLLVQSVPVSFNDLFHVYSAYGYADEFGALLQVNPAIEPSNYEVFPHFLQCLCFNNYDRPVNVNCWSSVLEMLRFLTFYAPKEGFMQNLEGQLEGTRYYYVFEPIFKKKRTPSLLELGRNAVRDIIYKKCSGDKVLNFYSIVNRLDVPKIFKDLLLLKKPVYPMDQKLFRQYKAIAQNI